MSETPGGALAALLGALDRQGIACMVSGSAASSIHGFPRMTRDIDLVARIGPEQIDPLVAALEGAFYADAEQAREALRHGRCFNVIHLESSFKFDIFPLIEDRYQQEQFGRRRLEQSSLFGPEPLAFAVATAEDVILSKLRWYRLGGEVSEQQWNDVGGVMAVQADALDMDYLRQWAEYLGVADLLARALEEQNG